MSSKRVEHLEKQYVVETTSRLKGWAERVLVREGALTDEEEAERQFALRSLGLVLEQNGLLPAEVAKLLLGDLLHPRVRQGRA